MLTTRVRKTSTVVSLKTVNKSVISDVIDTKNQFYFFPAAKVYQLLLRYESYDGISSG